MSPGASIENQKSKIENPPAPVSALTTTLAALSPSAARLFLLLFAFADRTTPVPIVKIPARTLAQSAGISQRWCEHLLRLLRTNGFLRAQKRHYHQPYTLILTLPNPPTPPNPNPNPFFPAKINAPASQQRAPAKTNRNSTSALLNNTPAPTNRNCTSALSQTTDPKFATGNWKLATPNSVLDTPSPAPLKSKPQRSAPMPAPQNLAGKNVLVMGLGRFGGGVGVSRWLAQQGARVTVTDSAKPEDLADSTKALVGLPITFKLGTHAVADFLNADLIVINPAVDRAKSDVVQAALKRGIPTTTEMNLFLERCPARAIGITGSVGKSTTTALIYEALQAALETGNLKLETPCVHLGGNIGRSLLLDLPAIRPHDYVVLELSSFMLEETPAIQWSPHIAVVTNVFPNHLDRHGTMAAYSAAKQNILKFQKPDDIAILNGDHDLVSRWTRFARGKVVKFTTRGPASKHLNMLMPGAHNQSNAAAAMAVIDALAAEGLPLDRAAALAAVGNYPGLPHRLQCVHTWEIPRGADPGSGAPRTVRFYNDSKATSPDASLTALEAFPPRSAIFIVGGYDKHIDMTNFIAAIAARAAGVLGIGQTGRAMVEAVAGTPHEYVETLDHAVAQAVAWAAQDSRVEAIVLSPASASWDQFANYEQRGDVFSRLVKSTSARSP